MYFFVFLFLTQIIFLTFAFNLNTSLTKRGSIWVLLDTIKVVFTCRFKIST